MTLVAIDIGGSGSRLRATGESGEIVHEARGPALTVTRDGIALDLVLDALTAALAPSEVSVVAVATAGITTLGDPDVVGPALRRRFGAHRAVVVPDVVASLVAAWGFAGGVVVSAGTGAIALGTDFASTWVRADGWGHLVGDAGGGAWIGARGLAAALRALDGRPGGSPALLARARDRYGDPARVPALLRATENEATALASFVSDVAAAAGEGDDVSRGVLADAGRALAETAAATMTDGIPDRIALVGGLRNIGPLLTAPFRDALAAARPGVEVALPEATTLDGAVTLAEEASRGGRPARPPYLNLYDTSVDPVSRTPSQGEK